MVAINAVILVVTLLHIHMGPKSPLCENMTSSTNWKYVTLRNAVRGGPSYSYKQRAQNLV